MHHVPRLRSHFAHIEHNEYPLSLTHIDAKYVSVKDHFEEG